MLCVVLCRGGCAPGAGQADVSSPLVSPQNTALDKEGQIFCSKHCHDSGRPGTEPTSSVPLSAEETPVSGVAAIAPVPPEPSTAPCPPVATGCERAGTWRRHRD